MPKCLLPILRSEHVRLRPLQESDLALTLVWRNRDDVRVWFIHSDVISPERHHAWFQAYAAKNDGFMFTVEETTQRFRPVGQVALYRVDWVTRRAELRRLLIGEPETQGCGLAAEATRHILYLAERSFEMEEAYLEVHADNLSARAIYGRCGFVKDGTKGRLVHMVHGREEVCVRG
jgi:RimJ/RimL family protein N-acetyltransferase